MSGPIQIIPPGLMGFLQLKNAGRNPTDLVESISPTFDMLRWYMEARFTSQTLPGTVTTVQSGTFQTSIVPTVVPAEEQWYVIDACIRGGLIVAGDQLDVSVAYRVGNTAPLTNHIFTKGERKQADGAAAGVSVYASASDFFLPPGAVLGGYFGIVTVASTTGFDVNVRYVALPL